MRDPKTYEQAVTELKSELRKVFEPILLPPLYWIDRQLRRSPRLYAWLERH